MAEDNPPSHVVLLVHGIRDYALWQSSVRDQLEKAGFTVEATNYGRFNLIEFILPIPYFRGKAIRTVWNQIRMVRQSYPGSDISIVAHSFGTFIVANILRNEFDTRFHRVIFCGSVVPYAFPFEQISNRFQSPIVNEVGTSDVWPAVAQSVTWGYGSAGTFGFRRPLVRDRWHNGARHGYFLEGDFTTRFWVPYLRDGTISPAASDPTPPSTIVSLIGIFPVKYIVPIAAVAIAAIVSIGLPTNIQLAFQKLKDVFVTEPAAPERQPEVEIAEDAPEVVLDTDALLANAGAAREWLDVAIRERGVAERQGAESNPRILEYFQSVDWQGPLDDQVPWSSAFVNWVMEKAGYEGTNSAVNASWSSWGKAVSRRTGCIAFFEPTSQSSGTGTVGFYLDGGNGQFRILGGNFSNKVDVVTLPDSRFVHCRWPSQEQ